MGKQDVFVPGNDNERKGSIAKEIRQEQNGEIQNPTWVKSAHYDWKNTATLYIKGFAAIAFDAKKERLFIHGEGGARRPRQSKKQRAKIHVRTNVSQQKGRPEGQKSKLLLNTDITDEDRLRNCVLNHAT